MKNWHTTMAIALVTAFPLSLGAFYLGSYERQNPKELGEKEVETWIQQQAKKIEASDVAILRARAEVLKHEEHRQSLIGQANSLRGKLEALTVKSGGAGAASASTSPNQAPQQGALPATVDIAGAATQKSPFGPARFIPFKDFVSNGTLNDNNLTALVKSIDFARGTPQIYVAGMRQTTSELRKLREALKPSGVTLLRLSAVSADAATLVVPERYLQ